MRKHILTITILIICILSEHSIALENQSVRSPVISSTVPQSSVSGGLVSTPNPMDNSINLVITGNVTGGKHFRGLVPYNSPTSFESQLGSSSLDSFLRYSAPGPIGGPANFRGSSGASYLSPGHYGPFFSPSGTVATLEAGQRAVNHFVDSRISNIVNNENNTFIFVRKLFKRVKR